MPNFVTPGVRQRPAGCSDTPDKPLLRQPPHGTSNHVLRCAQRVGYSIDRESIISGK